MYRGTPYDIFSIISFFSGHEMVAFSALENELTPANRGVFLKLVGSNSNLCIWTWQLSQHPLFFLFLNFSFQAWGPLLFLLSSDAICLLHTRNHLLRWIFGDPVVIIPVERYRFWKHLITRLPFTILFLPIHGSYFSILCNFHIQIKHFDLE